MYLLLEILFGGLRNTCFLSLLPIHLWVLNSRVFAAASRIRTSVRFSSRKLYTPRRQQQKNKKKVSKSTLDNRHLFLLTCIINLIQIHLDYTLFKVFVQLQHNRHCTLTKFLRFWSGEVSTGINTINHHICGSQHLATCHFSVIWHRILGGKEIAFPKRSTWSY